VARITGPQQSAEVKEQVMIRLRPLGGGSRRSRAPFSVLTVLVALLIVLPGAVVPSEATGNLLGGLLGSAPSPPPYRLNDYADGRAMSILPPGANGHVSAVDLLAFQLLGTRPTNSQDQLGKYADLLYGYPTLTDAGLPSYFNDASFGVRPADVVRTDRPRTDVTIYRDRLGVPHVYGQTNAGAAFGAGYAQAQDRLFMMDALRHTGSGRLGEFLGAACAFQQSDHDQLLDAAYTPAQAQAQVDNLAAYGARGVRAKEWVEQYVKGVNAYIGAILLDPTKLPADYAAVLPGIAPKPWVPGDVVAVASLIGGQFGRGGGLEVVNAALLQYLQAKFGADAGAVMFKEFKAQNDPLAPTVVNRSFPYMVPGQVDPATTALPMDAAAPLTGGPVATAPGCGRTSATSIIFGIIAALRQMPGAMSNAVLINGNRTTDGHPIAVFGPQVGYYAPQILSLLDVHAPDYDASGVSFPGTGVVAIGRGRDYAWSATSALSDITDQRLEVICDPAGGAPDPQGKHYLFNGACTAMTQSRFTQTSLPKAEGTGLPAIIKRDIYRTRHGIVQGWTTAKDGRPVAVVDQRSTYGHEIDSLVGLLGFGTPSVATDVRGWMTAAEQVQFTFNWFYVDDRDTGYFLSGRDPVRPGNVDPNLPTWGTGQSEWQGWLPANRHPQAINPAQGYLISWNNKPAPGFSAADDEYGYGAVHRSLHLVEQLTDKLASRPKLTRADVVQVVEAAATQDLYGTQVVPELLAYLGARPQPAGVQAMVAQLRAWAQAGGQRRKASAGATQYQHAAAVAISDELIANLNRAVFDRILADGGIRQATYRGAAHDDGYTRLPMAWVNGPAKNATGGAYVNGYESYLVTILRQLRGLAPSDAFSAGTMSHLCEGGPATCQAAIDNALASTYQSLVAANGSADPASWTASAASAAAAQPMPAYDAIRFTQVGIIGQPNIDWQNRPTFQQVVSFPRHRPRS
jgi:acyl-homoserine lactone acylase PvdQ